MNIGTASASANTDDKAPEGKALPASSKNPSFDTRAMFARAKFLRPVNAYAVTATRSVRNQIVDIALFRTPGMEDFCTCRARAE